MKTYEDMVAEVRRFLKETSMNPHDLVRVAKNLCCCVNCKFFVQHYTSDSKETDFGHCTKNKHIRCVRPHDISCGYWEEIKNGSV